MSESIIKLSDSNAADRFIKEFGITFEEAESILESIMLANQRKWDELISLCMKPRVSTPKYFMAYHSRRYKIKMMLKELGYDYETYRL